MGTPGLHRVYTGFTPGLNRVYTGFTPGLHPEHKIYKNVKKHPQKNPILCAKWLKSQLREKCKSRFNSLHILVEKSTYTWAKVWKDHNQIRSLLQKAQKKTQIARRKKISGLYGQILEQKW